MCFRFLQVMWRYLRTGRVPHAAHGIDYEKPHDEAAAGGVAQVGVQVVTPPAEAVR
jgi:hypothetical protein